MENINVPKNIIKYIDVDDNVDKLIKSKKKIKILFKEKENQSMEKLCKIKDFDYMSEEETYANTDIYIVYSINDINSLLDFYSKNLGFILEQ